MCKSANVYDSDSAPIYLNIDILRFVAPCRANRDESGRPKTIEINGAERLRFSSQSIKASIREAFGFVSNVNKDELKKLAESYDGDEKHNHSYYLPESVVYEVCGSKEPKEDEKEATSEGKDNVILYVTLENLHNIMMSKKDIKKKTEKEDKKNAKDSKDGKKGKATKKECVKDEVAKVSPDIDLFGRMYASNDAFKVEACAQVAHAVSVGKVEIIDDNWVCRSSIDGQAGCVTMGESGIGSALMYFNASLNISELNNRKYSKEQIIDIVKRFVMSNYSLEMKSGASGTAHNALPCYCRVTIKNSSPKNHLGAFYTPVDGDDTIEDVISELDSYINGEIEESECINDYKGIENKGDSFRFKANKESLDKLNAILNDLV